MAAVGSRSKLLQYHEETNHSELSVRTSSHYLDWENKPFPFKEYGNNLPSVALPHDFPHPDEGSLDAIRGVIPAHNGGRRMNLKALTEVLFFSAGLTRKIRIGPDFYYMRAASATGALYPIELYVVSGDVAGLDPGVYHFNPLRFALVRLREGDFRPHLAAACGADVLDSSPAALVLTSLAWRNAWKYGARSYRHWFWDAGVIAANLLAVCASEGLSSRLVVGFVDSKVDRLLGLRAGKEATVAVAPLGIGLSKPSPAEGMQDAEEIFPEYDPPSTREEVKYPSIWKANEASSIATLPDVRAWRLGLGPRGEAAPTAVAARFPVLADLRDFRQPPLTETILRRGSTRRFAREAIRFEDLSMILDASSEEEVPFDFRTSRGVTLTEFYVIANQVDGLRPGSYHFDHAGRSLELLKEGELRGISAYLCLEQPIFGDASAVIFMMTDLNRVVASSSLGERGYRAAQFEAGARAGKVYLSAYSLGIGASGSTFYDEAVTAFFSPHARGMSPLIAVGVGIPAYRVRPGTILPQMH